MKRSLLIACALLVCVAGFTQELIRNGDFKLPDDGKKYLTIDSIPNWKTDDHRVNANIRDIYNGNAVCNQWDEAGSFYQVVGVIPPVETNFAVNYKVACTSSKWAGWKVPLYVIFSAYSGNDPKTRVPIDSIKTELWTAKANFGKDSTINEQYTLKAGNDHAGDHLVIEFKLENSLDSILGSSYTYLNYDDISVIATGGQVIIENQGIELLSNGDFSLPADSLEHKNVNSIPNWKTDTDGTQFNGRINADAGPRKNEAVCWLWDETPGIYQVTGFVPSVATKYDVSFDLSCFYTQWIDYKSEFYVIFSSYTGDFAVTRIPFDTIKVIFDCNELYWFKFINESASFVLPAASAHAGEQLVIEFKPKNSEDFALGSSNTHFWLDNTSVKSSIYTGLIDNIKNDIEIIAFNGQIRINGANRIKSVAIYDLTGRKILLTKPERNVVNVAGLSGFYIVVVDSDSGTITKKVIF